MKKSGIRRIFLKIRLIKLHKKISFYYSSNLKHKFNYDRNHSSKCHLEEHTSEVISLYSGYLIKKRIE